MDNKSRQIKNVWMISREYSELAGAGGVKDVVYQLSRVLARWTARAVTVVIPCYGFIDQEKEGFQLLPDPQNNARPLQLEINMDLPDRSVKETVRFWVRKDGRVTLYLVEAERYTEKLDVYTYTEEEELASTWKKASSGHYDYFALNVLHQKAAIELMIVLRQSPDVIHCHDGHTAILPAMIRESSGYSSYFRSTGCLVTLHNAGHGYHQEVADIPYAFSVTGLPKEVVDSHQLEEKFDPFVVCSAYAVMNTVSPNYARELQETENDKLTGWLGHQLHARGVTIEGITNGIDPGYFGPGVLAEEEPLFFFDPKDIADDLIGKKNVRNQLVEEIGRCNDSDWLDGIACFGDLAQQKDRTLFTFVGRLSEQKGVDVLLEVLPVLFQQQDDVSFLALGQGAPELELGLQALAQDSRFAGRVCYLKGYSTKVANRVFAAGDFFIIPSRYEPCGLTDYIAQLNGNIPVVHHVGGLVKVEDNKTGIAYQGNSPDVLLSALKRCLGLDPVAKRVIQQRAVQVIEEKFTWKKVMEQYIVLYKQSLTQLV